MSKKWEFALLNIVEPAGIVTQGVEVVLKERDIDWLRNLINMRDGHCLLRIFEWEIESNYGQRRIEWWAHVNSLARECDGLWGSECLRAKQT